MLYHLPLFGQQLLDLPLGDKGQREAGIETGHLPGVGEAAADIEAIAARTRQLRIEIDQGRDGDIAADAGAQLGLQLDRKVDAPWRGRGFQRVAAGAELKVEILAAGQILDRPGQLWC